MRELLITIIITSAIFTSYAQNFSVRTGLNLSTVKQQIRDGASSNSQILPGFHLGGVANFHISKVFAFETGLFLSTKGSLKKESDLQIPAAPIHYKSVTTLYYLDIPLIAKAYIKTGKTRLYFNLGSYVGIGLAGNIKSTITTVYSKNDNIIKSNIIMRINPVRNYYDIFMNRIDFGILAGTGFEIKSLQVEISYELGLISTEPQPYSYANYNRTLGISVGYKFSPN